MALDSAIVQDGQEGDHADFNKVRKDLLITGAEYVIATGSLNDFIVAIDDNSAIGNTGEQITSIVAGHKVRFKANQTLSGVETNAPTITVKDQSAATILAATAMKLGPDVVLQDGDVRNTQILEATYDGTIWQVSSISGSGTSGFTATAGENVNGSSTPQAVHISDGSGARTAGRYYKSDADDTTNAGQKFDGFVKGNITAGSTDFLITRGIVSGFSGLTQGEIYYVDTTAGSITTKKTGLKVGVAISATQILIDKDDNYFNLRLASEDSFNLSNGITTDQTVITFTLPGGILGPNDELVIEGFISSITASTDRTYNWKLKAGGVAILTNTNGWDSSYDPGSGHFKFSFLNNASITAQQLASGVWNVEDGKHAGINGYNTVDVATSTEDTSADITIALTVAITISGNTDLLAENIVAKIIKGR